MKNTNDDEFLQELDSWLSEGWLSNHGDADNISVLARVILGRSFRPQVDWGLVLAELLRRNTDPDQQIFDGSTPLILASQIGFTEAIDILISYGADTELQDERGNTALLVAAENLQIESVRHLIKNKANKAHRNLAGKTAEDLAYIGAEIAKNALPSYPQSHIDMSLNEIVNLLRT